MSAYLNSIQDALTDPTTILLATLIALVTFLAVSSLVKNRNCPPGPWGLPVIGYAPFMTSTPHLKLSKLSEKYGNVIMIRIMGDPIVHLNDYEVTREAFVEKGDAFGGKPQDFSFFQWIADGKGIAQSEGPTWKEHRRFALHTLRDFGFGKLSLERRVLEIVGDLVQTLENSKGEPIDIVDDLSNCATNAICSLLFDKHYARDDPEFLETRETIKSTFGVFRGAAVFLAAPLAKILPIEMLPSYSKVAAVKQRFHALARKQIEEHVKTFDPDNLRDYMDAFIAEKNRLESEGNQDHTFTLDRLTAISLNLFFAGTETISSTLYWGFKLLVVHQDVQKKVQEEIDSVVGKERQPSIMDKAKMPYTEAVIAEIHRFASIVAFVPVHSNPEEATLAGYTIPKRSIIMANLWAINNDPRHFINPELFNPGRFLEPDGTLRKVDNLMPFSVGKRACPGEALARMEVFLFITSVLQRFNLVQPEGVQDESFECAKNVFRKLNPYQISAKLRF